MSSSSSAVARREHRIALVLYGGVSLCIYMHGTTKEVNRLVRASAALAGADVGELQPSEAVYRDLLEAKAEKDEVRTDVVVDVIAGTSAGGINGVYLAKALAGDRSQSGLRELWLKEADINLLLRSAKWLPRWARIAKALTGLTSESALDGDLMSRLLYRALEAMDDDSTRPGGAPRKSLVPEGAMLDLLVTTTDFYGYERQVPIWDPRSVHDAQHRHVFHFTAGSSGSDLGSSDSLALAFSARATSCFPAAFEPVSRPTFEQVVGGDGTIEDSVFRVYGLAGADPDETFFIDGGVLDNRPFAPAIEAIRAKPADVEVQRTLIYLDPDPEPLPPPPEGKKPGVIETAVGAIAGLPRKQPILDSLLELDATNVRVAELQEVIRASFQDVAAEARAVVATPLPSAPDPQMPERELRLRVAARERSQLTYPSYLRLRIEDTLDRLARATCAACDYPAESTHALLVLACWQEWGRQAGLLQLALEQREGQHPLLQALDVGFGERRLRFTLAGVNWLYQKPDVQEDSRAGIDLVKQRLWSAILELTGALDDVTRALQSDIEAAFPEGEMRDFLDSEGLWPEVWLERKQAELDGLVRTLAERLGSELGQITTQHYLDLLSLGEQLPAERREDVLLRYVGFPLWDVQLYPLERVAEAGERDAVKVMRTSPPDATLLTRDGDGAKLKGIAVHHFGAFFDLAARENDYLIGRLDGAERLTRLLLGDDPARIEWSRRAFLAILDEEEPVLKTAGQLIAKLRERAGQLTTREPPAPPAEKKNELPGP
jgi:patatin-related protein